MTSPNPYEPPKFVEASSAAELNGQESSTDSEITSTDDEVRALIWIMVGGMAFLLMLGLSRGMGGWHWSMWPAVSVAVFSAWRVTVIGGKRWNEWNEGS